MKKQLHCIACRNFDDKNEYCNYHLFRRIASDDVCCDVHRHDHFDKWIKPSYKEPELIIVNVE